MGELTGIAEEAQEGLIDEEVLEVLEAQEVQEVRAVQAARTDPEIMMMKEATKSAAHLSIAVLAETVSLLEGELQLTLQQILADYRTLPSMTMYEVINHLLITCV
jgi:hypothetical protein